MPINRAFPHLISRAGHFLPFLLSGQDIGRRTVRKTSRKHPENIQKIINEISDNPNISMHELTQRLSLTEGSVRHHLSSLKKKGILKRIGPDKGGYWKVVK
ncbi:MAG: hypothetical protein COS41_03775 [Elusimicrobia bacterium CG03_land_8_20_14_0_80_50_18]|nr:MAG: hypothetical protein COS41_03775 [Elusimicrobia bacterium CG03_land_8_20_14_0_80_50_18]PIX14644.1 MAG: hypothetical protein COZ72_05585 [Elusimicrobia bacterium CG_4_8_14_3_um_filter_50_9]